MGARRLLAVLGPGLLIAATGVGAGDLATAGFAGGHLGLACLWAVVLGAVLKYALTEGLARFQLVTGETLLEGAVKRLGLPVRLGFPLYLLPWTYVVGAALMSACGVCAAALFPVFENPAHGKVVFGMAHSAIGLLLVLRGSFRFFERLMQFCIGAMFLTVVVTACTLVLDWSELFRGLLLPTIPDEDGKGLGWTIALIGGVGGTLTVLCYGYWIREEGREGPGDIGVSRIDLLGGYVVTALFGLAMVIIGSNVAVEGKGATLIVDIATRLETQSGSWARWAFLIGAWGAVFSSLLGVWQAVPYLFADFVRHARQSDAPVDTKGGLYRGYLLGLATIPAIGLFADFKHVQKVYAVIGAAFLPVLALTLLALGRRAILGEHRNGPLAIGALVLTLLFFAIAGVRQIAG